MVEISEFPHLAIKHKVQGVPHTVINDDYHLVGSQGPLDMAKAVLEAINR